jgi:uncharacterized OsmC-like protein
MNATTQAVEAPAKKTPVPMNGVNTPVLLSTIFDVVAGQPQLAKFTFRANGKWLTGTHMRSTMSGFFGAGGEHQHKTAFTADADHPAILVGEDNGPTPVEYLLHALAACLTAGIANIASARGVALTSVESTVEGDIDLLGIFGLSNEVRNGYQALRVSIDIKGDAPAEKLAEIVAQSKARSAVFDVLTNGVPVEISVKA